VVVEEYKLRPEILDDVGVVECLRRSSSLMREVGKPGLEIYILIIFIA
jgi:hypothetical protein